MRIEFGVFDHLDRGNAAIRDVYASRLQLAEAYDAAGFFAYHLAEHHATSLSMAPAPSIFLSAVAQRTQRLRLGPMVYVLPLYDPLRLIEEICMLDQLSGGRLELGVGRGFSPFELGYFGVGHLEARSRYEEALAIILAGLAADVLNHRGEHYRYVDVPMVMKPLQRPHPPLWNGVTRPDGAANAARLGINALMNGPVGYVRPLVERYVSARDGKAELKAGLTRHIHVAETDAKAEETARRAYEVWYRSNAELWRRFQTETTVFPSTYEDAKRQRTVIVGSPDTVRRRVEQDMTDTGADYLVGRYAFGDMPTDSVLRSIDLMSREVMPYFKSSPSGLNQRLPQAAAVPGS
jgi:alkanesulfonate monooxygenase SsuD/methylene tetrahydromethanopterin reductase-like flavin-dependent oxidoreductase (luciferase family)